MKLITKAQEAQLRQNGRISADSVTAGQNSVDHDPVVLLFAPFRRYTWLLSEIDPDNTDLAYCLFDYNYGSPGVGWVSLKELTKLGGFLGLGMTRHPFTACAPFHAYVQAAFLIGRIVT
jgi:hypothetical protein